MFHNTETTFICIGMASCSILQSSLVTNKNRKSNNHTFTNETKIINKPKILFFIPICYILLPFNAILKRILVQNKLNNVGEMGSR